jgi:hypothetical protein
MTQPIVIKANRTRDILIAVAAGAIVLGFVVYGILHMSSRVASGDLVGTITAKHFKPQEEEQITLGAGGLRERKIDGQYTLEVQVPPDNRIYTVWVDRTVFDSRKVGDQFRFPRPAPTPQ